MEETGNRKLYMTEKIKNMAYNFKYKAIGYLEEYQKQGLLSPN